MIRDISEFSGTPAVVVELMYALFTGLSIPKLNRGTQASDYMVMDPGGLGIED